MDDSLNVARPVSAIVYPEIVRSAVRGWHEVGVVIAVYIVWMLCVEGVLFASASTGALPSFLISRLTEIQVLLIGTSSLYGVGMLTWFSGQGLESLGLRRVRVLLECAIGAASLIPAYGIGVVVGLMSFLLTSMFGNQATESLLESRLPMIDAVSSLSPWSIVPIAVFVGIYEELLFRGYFLTRLTALAKSEVWGVVLSSLLFGLFHLPSQGLSGFAQTTCLGLVMALLCLWRKSIWSAIVCHILIDVVGIALVLLMAPLLKEALQAQGMTQ